MDLLSIQGNLDLITKTELIEWARRHDIPLTSRQITSYITEGLLPKTARIGSRVAYPKMVTEQLRFVSRQRRRGMSVSATRQLLPLWRYLRRAINNQEVSLQDLQDIAGETLTSEEAMYAVPAVLQQSVPCPRCLQGEHSGLKFRMKDGSVKSVAAGDEVSIGFALAIRDSETGEPCDCVTMRIALSRVDEGHNNTSIVLGLKPGEELPDHTSTEVEEPESVGHEVEIGAA